MFSSVKTKFTCCLVLLLSSPLSKADKPHQATGKNGMVVSVCPIASDIGRDILQQGGNAVDAAVAVGFALTVTWPEAGNIGGGGFMMVHPPKGECLCIEYRETAPAAVTMDMYSLSEKFLDQRASGVPGTVRGLALAHEKFGRLPWKELVLPSVKIAQEGITVDRGLADSLNWVLALPESRQHAEFLKIYQKQDGSRWQPGDRLVQPDLAKTLELIAEYGPEAFYKGKIAEQIVQEMKSGNGMITLADLEGYEAKIREPIHSTFRGYDVYGPPPPSSGGICLALVLNVLEEFDLNSEEGWSTQNSHLVAETMKRAFLDRALHLGDADFVSIPEHLTSKDYAKQIASQISLDQATPSLDLAKEKIVIHEAESTTHYSIVDGDGLAVSNTYTLEASFGSRVVVKGAGFLLNNEMGDFNRQRGYTDTRGHIGTEPNLIAPKKRMLSSQTPVIVAKEGEPVLITGSPGGRTIINTVLCVVLNVLAFDMPLSEAVAAPRMHHQWFPDRIQIEISATAQRPELKSALETLGHQVMTVSKQGDAHSILRNPDTNELHGVADDRRNGKASGF